MAQGAPERPAIRPVFDTEIQRIDDEIARLVMNRAGLPVAEAARLDLRVDLRIYHRWTLQLAAEQDDWSDLQAAVYARSRVWQNAVLWADKTFGASAGGALPASVTDWHLASLQAKPPKSLAEADAQAKGAAVALIPAMKTLPPGFDAKPMRPPVPKLPAPPPPPRDEGSAVSAQGQADASPKPASVAELRQRVLGLTLSPELRRQLLQLADAAQGTGSAGGRDDKEAGVLRDALQNCVQVAEGLSGNLAVTPESRAKLEADLASVAALLPDPRLRDGARKKLASIAPYAKFLARVGTLKLTEDQLRQFGPIITYARSASDGPVALDTIESFLRTTTEFDARFPAGTPNAALPTNLRTASEAVLKAFASHRASFLELAGRPDSAEPLVRQVNELRYGLDLLSMLEELPKIQDSLSTIKTKPPGGVDRKIAQAVPIAAGAEASVDRNTARQFLEDVRLLSQAVAAAQAPISLKPEVARLLLSSNITPEKLETKRKATLQEQGNALAGLATVTFDRNKLTRLLRLKDLLDIASDLADFQSALAATDITGKWVDLSPPSATHPAAPPTAPLSPSTSTPPRGTEAATDNVLSQFYSPFASPVLSLFQAYLDDSSEGFDRARRAHLRLLSALRLARNLAEASKTTVGFPSGELLLAQQLLTPLDKAPFRRERLLTLIAFALPMEDEIPEVLLRDLLRGNE